MNVQEGRAERARLARQGTTRRLPWLLVLVFVLSLPAVTPRIYAADEVEYFAFLRSLWFDHDVSFDNEYRYFYDSGATRTPLFRDTFLEAATPTGHRENFATIGCALLWAPFYGLADIGVHAARLLGSTVPSDGYSRPYLVAVAIGSAVYGFLALLLSAHAARMLLEPRRDRGSGNDRLETPQAPGNERWVAMAVVWLGTPLLFYMYVAPAFSHAVSAFVVAAFVVSWLHVRRTWSLAGMAGLGALAALMTMVREQDAFFVGGVALDFAWALVRDGPSANGLGQADHGRFRAALGGRTRVQMAARALVGCVVAAVAFLPQAASYVAINGRLGPSLHVSEKMHWTSPYAVQVLFSPEHGFLFWTPLAVVALAGLIVLVRRGGELGRIGICLVAMFALQVYVAGAVASWNVAGAFGHRRFIGLTLLLVVGLAAALSAERGRFGRRAVVATLLLTTWWNIALMVQFGTGMMERQRLTLGRNAWNAFVAVPVELPRIAYRYVFDRSSFYAK